MSSKSTPTHPTITGVTQASEATANAAVPGTPSPATAVEAITKPARLRPGGGPALRTNDQRIFVEWKLPHKLPERIPAPPEWYEDNASLSEGREEALGVSSAAARRYAAALRVRSEVAKRGLNVGIPFTAVAGLLALFRFAEVDSLGMTFLRFGRCVGDLRRRVVGVPPRRCFGLAARDGRFLG